MKFREDMWKEQEIEYLKNNFINKSNKEVSDFLGRSKAAVKAKSRKMGIRRPEKYIFNKRYFKIIDSEEKAYWLGFIYADGYVSGKYELAIQLKKVDLLHLEKFRDCLGSNYPVTSFSKFTFGKYHDISQIRIYSKIIVDDLLNHGIKNNKSLTIKFPYSSLSKDLIRHFIRGFFDGDGSIYCDKSKDLLRAKFTCGSKEFLESLSMVLNKEGVDTYFIQTTEKTHEIGIPNKKSTKIFLEYIYGDAHIFLDRKMKFYTTHKNLLVYLYDAWNNK